MTKVLQIRTENQYAGIVRLREDGFGTKINISVTAPTKNPVFAVFDGNNYHIVKTDDYLKGVFCRNNFCLAVFSDNVFYAGAPLYAAKNLDFDRFLEGYNKSKNQPLIYDDFKIAEENYFDKESRNEEDYDDDKTQIIDLKKEQEKQKTPDAKDYEADDVALQKSSYKPDYYLFCQSKATKQGLFSQKINQEFFRITNGKKRLSCLENMICGTKIFIMNGDKFYIFGAVFEKDSIKSFIYGVPSDTALPKGFEKAFFVPESFFDNKKGYYCFFAPPKSDNTPLNINLD